MYFIHHSGIKMDQFDDRSSSEINNNDEIEIDEESAHIVDVVTGPQNIFNLSHSII
jgi:hypothetical protein